MTNYTPPVDKLLKYGDCRNIKVWPNYPELGLHRGHIPELIRMAVDPELAEEDTDGPEVWAPVHAWRALGQLRAEEAIEPLIQLFHEQDDDWVLSDLPKAFGMIGEAAIPPLESYLADPARGTFPRIGAADSLQEIATAYPNSRERVVSILSSLLGTQDDDVYTFNGLLISALVDLKAVEAAPAIREVFEKDLVDEFIAGDWEEVQIALGLRQSRSAPALADGPSLLGKGPSRPAQPIKTAKIGRNDPCPCGSGKKYKKCCMNR